MKIGNIEKLATNSFIFLLISSAILSVLTYGLPINGIFLVISGMSVVLLLGGHGKRLNGSWKGKLLATKKKKDILDRYTQIAFEEMWRMGYRDNHVASNLRKYNSKVINTK